MCNCSCSLVCRHNQDFRYLDMLGSRRCIIYGIGNIVAGEWTKACIYSISFRFIASETGYAEVSFNKTGFNICSHVEKYRLSRFANRR